MGSGNVFHRFVGSILEKHNYLEWAKIKGINLITITGFNILERSGRLITVDTWERKFEKCKGELIDKRVI